MICNKSFLTLLFFSIVGGIVLATVSVQPSYSSPAEEETSDEEQEQGGPAGDEEEPVDEEPSVEEPETEPSDQTNPQTTGGGEDLANQTGTSGPIVVERHPCPGEYVREWGTRTVKGSNLT